MSAALLGLGVVLAVVLLSSRRRLTELRNAPPSPLATVKGLITQLLVAPAPRKGITVAIPAGHVPPPTSTAARDLSFLSPAGTMGEDLTRT